MHRKTLSLTLPLALTATAIAATATPGSSPAATTDTVTAAPDSLRWGPCPPGTDAPGLRCATLDVPLDHRAPDGRQIQIAVSRLASKDPAKRRGVLVTNPGGPGGAGLTYPAVLAATGLPKSVLDSYDVMASTPVASAGALR